MVAIGAGAGMAAVYSVPLGGALFALEVLRGALALRLVVPALAAALIATKTASFVVPNAPLYAVPVYEIPPDVYLWAIIASPFIGLWSVAFVRAIAWAYRVRPSGWGRFIAPPLVFAVIGLLSIVFPELLGNGQDVAQLLFLHPLAPFALAALVLLRPLATVASVASGAPGGLFTPSLAAGALAGAGLGQLWLLVHPGGDIGLYALLGAGAMLAASTQGPISSLVLMMELTGQARAFALPMLTAIVIATATARLIEWRSIYEARLTDEEVAERLQAREPRRRVSAGRSSCLGFRFEPVQFSGDNVRRELVFEPRHLVAQHQLSLLKPLQLQLVCLAGASQRLDRRVEVAVLFAQPLDLGDQRRMFLRRKPLRPFLRTLRQAFEASTPRSVLRLCRQASATTFPPI